MTIITKKTISISECDKPKYRKFILDSSKPNLDGCWVWLRGLYSSGFALVAVRELPGHHLPFAIPARRLAFAVYKGDLLKGERVRNIRSCGTRSCVNPDHLRLVKTILPNESQP